MKEIKSTKKNLEAMKACRPHEGAPSYFDLVRALWNLLEPINPDQLQSPAGRDVRSIDVDQMKLIHAAIRDVGGKTFNSNPLTRAFWHGQPVRGKQGDHVFEGYIDAHQTQIFPDKDIVIFAVLCNESQPPYFRFIQSDDPTSHIEPKDAPYSTFE